MKVTNLVRAYLASLSMIVWAPVATACMACTATMSYNAFRFAAPWLALYLIWLFIRIPLVDMNHRSAMLKRCGWMLFVIFLVSLFTGLQLVFGLAAPALFLIASLKKKMPRAYRLTALGLLCACILSLPISIIFLPSSYSEPLDRAKVNQSRQMMRETADKIDISNMLDVTSAGPEIHEQVQLLRDPFAIENVMNPLSFLTFGFGAYRPLPEEESKPRSLVGSEGYAIWMRGPDAVFNPDFEPVLQSAVDGSTVTLETWAYDPTNGIISTGELWLLRSINTDTK